MIAAFVPLAASCPVSSEQMNVALSAGFGGLCCVLEQLAVTCWSTGRSWPHVLGRVSEVV